MIHNKPIFHKSLCIFLFLSLGLVFLPSKCNGQFHWGKNHSLEIQRLRNMISKLRPRNYLTMNDVVSPDTGKVEENDQEQDDRVGYVFGVVPSTSGDNNVASNNENRSVLMCVLFKFSLPKCGHVLVQTLLNA